MSSEATTNIANKTHLLSGIGGSIAMNGIMTGGFGSLSSLKRNKGFKTAFKDAKESKEILEKFLEKNKEGDIFSKRYATAKNYDELVGAKKTFKKLEKLKNADGSFKTTTWQKIKKIFTKKDYSSLNASAFDKADDTLKTIVRDLENGVDLSKITTRSFGKNLGSMFKSEFKDPIGLFSAGSEVFERFTTQAIPAFKNEGFIAGIKETGKAIAAGGATLVADAGLSVAFRTIGATVGGFLGPLGASIGSIVGNAIGGLISYNLINKIFPKKETLENQTLANNNSAQISQESQQQVQETSQTVSENQTNPIQQDLSAKYANMPSRHEIKQAAYAQAFQGKGGRFNRYYA